ncbi:MAG: acyl-phosphate glycerol 3-phosphate acyltransferase [Gammaproteobacteria bacterium]|nr:MAG: acyl-phosphate glycerol 3-phosphate acyltransferase [Gammaproteobacteria bacterium]PIE36852.1 MAG: acyl-phosphate glycerol 3-phosphate acyltransferase [Gammaproteobacteria bacterium]
MLTAAVSATLAYLAGSLSAAIITCRLLGLPDPRGEGSGNPGATNVLRLGGKKAAAITLLGDALKGYLPVLLTSAIIGDAPTVALVALAAFLGHLRPVFFNFRGGKGVATAFGALLGMAPGTGFLAILSWLAIALVFRRSSLAALVTFALVPIYLLAVGKDTYALAFLIIGVLLFCTHRSNIQRLRDGTEPMIGKR